MATPKITIAASLEMEEYLCAVQLAQKEHPAGPKQNELTTSVRVLLRSHRIATLTWLMQHGIPLPLALLSDQVHRMVGNQTPDALAVANQPLPTLAKPEDTPPAPQPNLAIVSPDEATTAPPLAAATTKARSEVGGDGEDSTPAPTEPTPAPSGTE